VKHFLFICGKNKSAQSIYLNISTLRDKKREGEKELYANPAFFCFSNLDFHFSLFSFNL